MASPSLLKASSLSASLACCAASRSSSRFNNSASRSASRARAASSSSLLVVSLKAASSASARAVASSRAAMRLLRKKPRTRFWTNVTRCSSVICTETCENAVTACATSRSRAFLLPADNDEINVSMA
ncbi:unnamed protein product [Pelagomonas calceolata]|uniref:Uncharacterized protein n=1 Tax=Pelagomonas calceolata TaxID=35677 RepID=A0A8J2SY47_9STRA|nr:unnamed protein product [Pelagomonas calceolata]